MMASNTNAVTIFAALEPDAELRSLVAGYKNQTWALVGPQTYLADPPHLTVYLAVFPDVESAAARWRGLATEGRDLQVKLIGWHVFESDALTGSNTLVCELAAEGKARLRSLQREVIDLLAPARDQRATRERLAPRHAFLTAEQRTCAERYGFPYVGEGWEPHFTIASVRADDWPRVWAALKDRPPRGSYGSGRWRLVQLLDGKFHAIDGLDEWA